MAKLKHSELVAKLAIEGVVAAIAGTVQGQLPVAPKTFSPRERAEAGIVPEGEFLFYPLDDAGVFFHTHGAFTTIWFAGADCSNAVLALDAAIKRAYPQAKMVNDGPHKTQHGWALRSYDIKLGNGKLAIVEAAFPMSRVDDPKFTVRVTAMAIKH